MTHFPFIPGSCTAAPEETRTTLRTRNCANRSVVLTLDMNKQWNKVLVQSTWIMDRKSRFIKERASLIRHHSLVYFDVGVRSFSLRNLSGEKVLDIPEVAHATASVCDTHSFVSSFSP